MSLPTALTFNQPAPTTRSILDPLTWSILMGGMVLYIFLSPIYVLESGLPQPADFIVLITSGLAGTIFVFKQNLVFNRVFASLILMVGLFTTINLANFYYFRDTLLLYGAVYYVFNTLVFCAVVVLFKSNPDKFIYYARHAVIWALIFQLIWILFIGGGSILRNTGTFNNPNQLGYWALLSACGLLLLCYGRRMNFFDFIGFLTAMILALESLSRAVVLSFILLFALLLIGRYIGPILKVVMVLMLVLLGLVQFILFGEIAFLPTKADSVQAVIERVEDAPNPINTLGKRGFERVIDHPQYMLFGAGEGAYYRFSPVSLEIHSGIGTVLFSYGLLGLVLFLIFSLSVFRKAPPALWITLIAVTLYGLTHQHIRFTWFWIFMGLAYGIAFYYVPLMRERKQI